MTQSSDDRQGKKRETEDLAKDMFKDVFHIPKNTNTLPIHIDIMERAKKNKHIVHHGACKLVQDKLHPKVVRQVTFDMFLERFRDWSKDDLLLFVTLLHTKMELADLGIPDVLEHPNIIIP